MTTLSLIAKQDYLEKSGSTGVGGGSSYVLQQSDVGNTITLNVTDVADNSGGTATINASGSRRHSKP
jgi:hypothetical protein